MIEAGQVLLDGVPHRRSSTPVAATAALEVVAAPDYVSRAGHKLAAALDAFATLPGGGPRVAGRRVLDAGASTGGFTQVALLRGASHVDAVDVGVDQIDPALRGDARVSVYERVNVRELDPTILGQPADLLVADLSFISLTLVLRPLTAALAHRCDAVVLVKPQFEVGRARLGKNGIVTDDGARLDAVLGVLATAWECGLRLRAAVPAVLAGEHGNREVVLWLDRTDTAESLGRADLPRQVAAEHRRCAALAVAGDIGIAEWSRGDF